MEFCKTTPMKYVLIFSIVLSQTCFSQQSTVENIFIITTDGFRWQELFTGADSAILFNSKYVHDTSLMRHMYWADSQHERRKKLMPFLWNFVSEKGQLWGNRNYGNEVSVNNPYRFSYAGYNEIFTGFADRSVIVNKPKRNRNKNVFSFLNSLPAFKSKVAVFGSWNLMSYILNLGKDSIPVNAGYDLQESDTLTETETITNAIQQISEYNKMSTRADILTFTLATEYIRRKHPRIVYISLGETDEFAHHGEYDNYLNQANQFDKMLSELWGLIQRDVFYKDKTSLFITTDHGRGRRAGKWSAHGPFIRGSEETWMVQLGPNIKALGEVKTTADLSNEQFAQTIAAYLGYVFTADHEVAEMPYTFKQEAGHSAK